MHRAPYRSETKPQTHQFACFIGLFFSNELDQIRYPSSACFSLVPLIAKMQQIWLSTCLTTVLPAVAVCHTIDHYRVRFYYHSSGCDRTAEGDHVAPINESFCGWGSILRLFLFLIWWCKTSQSEQQEKNYPAAEITSCIEGKKKQLETWTTCRHLFDDLSQISMVNSASHDLIHHSCSFSLKWQWVNS